MVYLYMSNIVKKQLWTSLLVKHFLESSFSYPSRINNELLPYDQFICTNIYICMYIWEVFRCIILHIQFSSFDENPKVYKGLEQLNDMFPINCSVFNQWLRSGMYLDKSSMLGPNTPICLIKSYWLGTGRLNCQSLFI